MMMDMAEEAVEVVVVDTTEEDRLMVPVHMAAPGEAVMEEVMVVDPEAAMGAVADMEEAAGMEAMEVTAAMVLVVMMIVVTVAAMGHLRRATTLPEVDTAQAATEEDRFNDFKYYLSQNYFNRNAFSLFYFCDVIHNKMFEN